MTVETRHSYCCRFFGPPCIKTPRDGLVTGVVQLQWKRSEVCPKSITHVSP